MSNINYDDILGGDVVYFTTKCESLPKKIGTMHGKAFHRGIASHYAEQRYVSGSRFDKTWILNCGGEPHMISVDDFVKSDKAGWITHVSVTSKEER